MCRLLSRDATGVDVNKGKNGRRTAGAGLVPGAVAGCCALLLAGCGPTAHDDGPAAGRTSAGTARSASPLLPVPRGGGSDTAADFNGDGHRDLVLDELVVDPGNSHGDDAGIGVVYGTRDGLVPGARQLLGPATHAARTQGRLPAVFDAEESCDLDGDGFTDLIVSTDPPYDGQGRPPVPLQILFGSPKGLADRAVKLSIPAQARFGDDWPDQPVCGDFDGDDAVDLVVHASDGRLSLLRGPFGRGGAPRAAGSPLASPGNVPTGPAADVDGDGYDDLLVRAAEGDAASAVVLGGPGGPARTGVTLPAGADVALGRFGRGRNLDAAVGSAGGTALRYDVPGTARGTLDLPGTALDAGDLDGDGLDELITAGTRLRVLRGRTAGPSVSAAITVEPPAEGTTRVLDVADYDGDGRADLVVRTSRGDTEDTVAVYPGTKEGVVAAKPVLAFSSAEFLETKG